jgi:hypothetical protein
MKVTVSKNDLKEALSKASSTLGKGEDITSHFLLKIKNETQCDVLSCDPPRMFSITPLAGVKCEGEGQFTIDGKRLLQAINSIEGVIEISYTEGDLSFSSLNPDNFPPWENLLSESEVANEDGNFTTNVMSDTLLNLKPYCSQNEQRQPELCMILFKEGKAFACDGFGLGMAKSEDFDDVELKIHYKDISSLNKFLKAYEGEALEILTHEKATFLRVSDGSTIGLMNIPFNMPDKITTQYAEAFEWTPRRVWKFNKVDLLNAISFLSSGASDGDYSISFADSEGEKFTSPQLEMKPSSGKGVLTCSLDSISFKPEEGVEVDPATIENLGERMWVDRYLQDKSEEGDDIASWKFNFLFMKRAIDVLSTESIIFGCNQESEKRGYMVFKNLTSNNVDVASVVGWII